MPAVLLDLWFESIPRIIQRTKNAISNHSLLQCSVLNIELGKNKRRQHTFGKQSTEKTAHLVRV